MSRYGELIANYMSTARPAHAHEWDRTACEKLATEIAAAVEDRELSLTNWSKLPPSTDHLNQVAALHTIRRQAEEEILVERLYETYPPDHDEDEDEVNEVSAATHAALVELMMLRQEECRTSFNSRT